MGKSLCENFKIAKEVFEEASEATHKDLSKLCFDGPESDLTLTENTQPCLVAASVAAFRVAESEFGFKPSAVAGHSLGEYSALVAAGALRLDAAARWVQERGRAMQKAVPAGEGKMAAVMGLDDPVVEQLCTQATESAKSKRASVERPLSVEAWVQPANFNAPGQVVIAGSVDAIDEALALISSGAVAGGKGVALNVSAPFHSKLMAPARVRMAEIFQGVQGREKPATLRSPYVPNRTGRMSSEPGIVLEMLVDQVDHPVLWKQSIETLIHCGFDRAVEFGPGKVLAGLAKRIAKPLAKTFEVASVGDTDALKAWGQGG
jgi:[acyl-carrier-protein] S-malonyltransferase